MLLFVNSFIDRPGNIGMRAGRILEALNAQGEAADCVCRGTQTRLRHVRYLEMGIRGHLPRLLNALRIYAAPWFDHRPLDIALFERFSLRYLPGLLRNGERKIAHVWDYCPRLIARLQAAGCRVLLDVPIAPCTYVKRLHQEGKAAFLPEFPRSMTLEMQAFRQADRLLAPSVFVADELVKSGISPEKISIVEFGCVPRLSPTLPLRESASGLDFCFAGNINLRKGVADLLAAWSDPAFSNDRLHLCGRLYPEARRILRTGHYSSVITPGFINPGEYFQGCDVFVFPSWMEGSAKAVYEAMACGLPVIVTHSAGSIARDGLEGFIVPAGDVAGLKARMLWLKAHPEQRKAMGEAARIRAGEFSWRRYAERVIQVYRDCLEETAGTVNQGTSD
jgi:glycosyltransferase involved in cell wall biosynthesis